MSPQQQQYVAAMRAHYGTDAVKVREGYAGSVLVRYAAASGAQMRMRVAPDGKATRA